MKLACNLLPVEGVLFRDLVRPELGRGMDDLRRRRGFDSPGSWFIPPIFRGVGPTTVESRKEVGGHDRSMMDEETWETSNAI